jgi:hypothetical protein
MTRAFLKVALLQRHQFASGLIATILKTLAAFPTIFEAFASLATIFEALAALLSLPAYKTLAETATIAALIKPRTVPAVEVKA